LEASNEHRQVEHVDLAQLPLAAQAQSHREEDEDQQRPQDLSSTASAVKDAVVERAQRTIRPEFAPLGPPPALALPIGWE